MIHNQFFRMKRKIPDRIAFTYWKLNLLKNRKRFKIRTSKILGYSIQYTDQLSLYFEFKDIFKNEIYHFKSQKPNPVIIDAGSCIGMSILYFKHVYPGARIIGFEPDKEIFEILQNNIKRNNLSNIELINAALSSNERELVFYPDGYGGSLTLTNENKGSQIEQIYH